MQPRDYSTAIEAIAASSGFPILEVTEWFLERASIAEYCGGIPRDEAERRAIEYCQVTFAEKARQLASERAARSANATDLDPQSCSTSNSVASGSKP